MGKIGRGEMVDDGDHSTVKEPRYDVLEHMGRWSSNWVTMQAENMKIRESCSELRKELEELRSQCESTTSIELDEVGEEIHQNRLGLQELFDERARLRKERSKVEMKVEQVEEEIKRRLLGKKVVVIEQEELDYIDKLEAHYREHPVDLRKFSSMDLVDEPFGDTFEQNAVEGKLETKRAEPRPGSPDKQNEVRYLKRNVEKEHEPFDTSEDDFLKQIAEIRRKTKLKKEDGSLKLSFVDTTVKGKRLAALIDTGATHSFVSRKTARSFGKKTKTEKESSAFKAVNSPIKVVDGLLKDVQIRVGSWFGKLDLRVVDMDDHSMVLGLDFMRLAQAIPMMDRDLLLITAEKKNMMIPMNRRSCLGYKPRMTSIILYPKDPNVKHTDVEQRRLGNIVQTTQERKFIDFIAKTGKKDEGNKEKTSRSWKDLLGISSTNSLRKEVAHEAGPSTTSRARKDEGYEGRYPTGIIDFCRYAMGNTTFN